MLCQSLKTSCLFPGLLQLVLATNIAQPSHSPGDINTGKKNSGVPVNTGGVFKQKTQSPNHPESQGNRRIEVQRPVEEGTE